MAQILKGKVGAGHTHFASHRGDWGEKGAYVPIEGEIDRDEWQANKLLPGVGVGGWNILCKERDKRSFNWYNSWEWCNLASGKPLVNEVRVHLKLLKKPLIFYKKRCLWLTK
jgi:hypothetical protein